MGVNEVRPSGVSLHSWAVAFSKLLPSARFIQKDGKSQRGQAHSLNVIRQRLAELKARYWLHWEESWRADAPFLHRAIATMDASGAVQVELASTGSTWDRFTSAIVQPGEGRVIQTPSTMLECNWTRLWDGKNGYDKSYWPLFTLHPSLNWADSILASDAFSERADKWPVLFEFYWACSLVRAGAS